MLLLLDITAVLQESNKKTNELVRKYLPGAIATGGEQLTERGAKPSAWPEHLSLW